MSNREVQRISKLINSLARSEDEAQDLWVFLLAGGREQDMKRHLEQLDAERRAAEFQSRVYWELRQGMNRVVAAMRAIRESREWKGEQASAI